MRSKVTIVGVGNVGASCALWLAQRNIADLVLVDEAHQQKEKSAATLLNAHYEAGAAIVGLTATPLGLKGLYDTLIVAWLTHFYPNGQIGL